MSAPEVTIVEDIRPLIAFVAPLVGVFGIAWAGEKRKNLRETFTFFGGDHTSICRAFHDPDYTKWENC